LKNEEENIKKNIDDSVNTLEIIKNIEIDENEIHNLIHNIDREIDVCSNKINEKEKILLQIDSEINSNPDSSESIKQLTSEKNKNDKVLKKLRAKEKAVQFIDEILAEAEKRREQKQLKKLIKNSIEKFNYLTGNQYITKIDEKMIQDVITKNITTVDFNPTVIHAILLSIKLSLTEFIVNVGITLPLIIDDPFYNMDDERMKRLKDLLDEASKTRQVILFTHQKDKKDWGNFLEL